MNRRAISIALALVVLALASWTGVAAAKDLCVLHEDDGEILVLKNVGRGARAVHGYVADFAGGNNFHFTPLAGTALVDADGELVAGLTQFHILASGGFTENISFHRLRCEPGSNRKLDVGDRCHNIEKNSDQLPEQDPHTAHVVPCNEIPAKP